jgi:hypothetical protein
MACTPVPRATPEPISNRPALDAIRYRIGTFRTFRRSMLQALSGARRAPDPPDALETRPLLGWTTRDSDDFGIAFVEMWAYLGDVLTFYQERIANEAYLRTGVRPRSTVQVVSLIGYRPAPGRSAVAWLAFRTEDDATVRVPKGLLVQSVPGQDEKPQKFETVEEIVALSRLNEMRPVRTQPQQLPRGSRRAVLAGIGHQLREGDWFVIAGDERREDPGSERWDMRRISSVVEDEEAEATTVTWSNGLGSPPRRVRRAILPANPPEFWVFRRRAWPFGANAPDYELYAATMTPEQFAVFVQTFKDDWNRKHLPEDEDEPQYLYLDTVYPNLPYAGWVGLITSEIDATEHPHLQGYQQYLELYPLLDVAETVRTGYTLASRVTRLTVDVLEDGRPEHIGHFPIRGTVVLVDAERIPLASVPLGHSPLGPGSDEPMPITGDTIELDGLFPELERGRMLLVSGTRLDAEGAQVGTASEPVRISSASHEDRTTLTLVSPLEGIYDRASVVIHGNVAAATHGETAAEVLGGGDAARPFQSFQLTKGPVTHVPQPGAPGGVASTLEIRVNGVRWSERQELHGQPATARVYVTRRGMEGGLVAHFGDGGTGARLPSGRANVEATYRVGLGPEGNVGADSLRTLLQKPLGLRSVSNPAPAAGGAAAEDPAAMKRTAPGTVRTFGRIVSLRDFEDSALEYIGIAKANASWRWDGESRVVDLVVAGDAGAPVAPLMSDLQADLDARRDPHRPLRIREFVRVPVSVRIDLRVDPAYHLEDVQAGAEKALRALFDFEALRLGETVHLSDIHAAIMRVEGVVAVDVDEFRFKHPAHRVGRGGDALVQPRLLLAPGELAWVEAADDLLVEGGRFVDREES